MPAFPSKTSRTLLRAAVPAAVVIALLPSPAQAVGGGAKGSAPSTSGQGAAAPSTPSVAPKVDLERTDVPAVKNADDAAGDDVVAELPKTRTDGYGLVGVTWSPKSDASGVKVQVRTRTDGTWSGWTDLDVEDDEHEGHGEDAHGDEGGNPGTEPLWVGDADGVAARVTAASGTPKDVQISTIDSGTDAGSTANASEAVARTDTAATASAAVAPIDTADGVARTTTVADEPEGTPSFPSRPTIITRSQWGAGPGTHCSSPQVGSTTRGVVIHHTAGSNSYTKEQSKSILRGIQAFHVKSRGWCDIGYNFLVDKYGQIFEGRKGGLDRNVRAAHSGNDAVNTYTTGISMMANLDQAKPTAAMQEAVVKLAGWRLGTTYLKAKGTYSLGGKTLNMIAGHRNVVSTGCPGKYGYAWIIEQGGLRDRVEDYLSKMKSDIKTRAASLGASRTGLVFIGEVGTEGGRRTRFAKMDIYSKSGAGTKFVAAAGGFRSRYDAVGGAGSALGFPTTDSPTTSSSVTAQRFQTGSIYDVPGRSTYAVTGLTDALYRDLEGSAGKLGSPRSSTPKKSESRTEFAGGYITATSSKAVAYTSGGTKLGSSTGSAPEQSDPIGAVGTVSASSTTSSATFSWSKASNAKSYEVCLKTSSAAASCFKTATTTSLTTTFSSLKPTPGTDYVGLVRGRDGSAAGPWTSPKAVNLKTTESASAAPAAAASTKTTSVTVPSSRTITVKGRGFGHGIGMSQYGAEGAARQGLGYAAILKHYYPGTKLESQAGKIRVLISASTSNATTVVAQSGMKFTDVSGDRTLALPTTVGGDKIDRWRMLPLSGGSATSVLQRRTEGGWSSHQVDGKVLTWKGDGQLVAGSPLDLVLPNGSMKLRGTVRSAKPSADSGSRDTVNVLAIDDYVRGVIAAEMPASWHSEALKSQAVAARTYGARSISSSRYYDICSTTACQVYGGASRETTATDKAVSGTAGKVLTYGGKPAFTQFSSSSGGYSAVGSQPYLKAVSDPYDGWSGNANRSWTKSVKASTIEKANPSIGKLKKLTITKRNGYGAWGGRVLSMSLQGSKKTVTITGNDARWDLGLKSSWFTF